MVSVLLEDISSAMVYASPQDPGMGGNLGATTLIWGGVETLIRP